MYLCAVMQNLFRNIGISYFMLLMLVKVLAVPAIALHYLINQDYIAANLCENKARPAMKCYGKCQLRKQLAKTSDSSESASQKLSQSVAAVDYCESFETIDFKASPSQDIVFHTIQNTIAYAGFPGNVFHPPVA